VEVHVEASQRVLGKLHRNSPDRSFDDLERLLEERGQRVDVRRVDNAVKDEGGHDDGGTRQVEHTTQRVKSALESEPVEGLDLVGCCFSQGRADGEEQCAEVELNVCAAEPAHQVRDGNAQMKDASDRCRREVRDEETNQLRPRTDCYGAA